MNFVITQRDHGGSQAAGGHKACKSPKFRLHSVDEAVNHGGIAVKNTVFHAVNGIFADYPGGLV